MHEVTGPRPDILGAGYEMMTLAMGTDYEGEVVATLVRRQPRPTGPKAVLYIHGYNDYFFQKHVADFYVRRGISFYALDLRKHGRSLLPHQTASLCRSLREYYPEIDTAVRIIKQDGHEMVLVNGHSTGGLTISLWAAEGNGRNLVDGLILNSPYLSSGVPAPVQLLVNPVSRAITKRRTSIAFPLSLSPHYTQSLHRSYHGEWEFNTKWKSVTGTRLRPAWLAGIHEGQRRVRKGLDIRMPVLVMCGTASGNRRSSLPELRSADAVLDVDRIARLSTQLGRNVTCIRIDGAVHDVFLSPRPAREQAFHELSRWLIAYAADPSAKGRIVPAHP